MSDDAARQSALSYLVDLWVQLQRDADRPDAELHRRDRELARQNRWSNADPKTVLCQWLDALRAQGESLPGRSAVRLFGLLRVALAALGLLTGWATAATLLAYDGTRPVNVVHLLAVFVGAQLLLLLLLGTALLPTRCARRIPGLARLQEWLAWLSPGQLTRLSAYALPPGLRPGFAHAVAPRQTAGRPLHALHTPLKWAVTASAQVFGVAFNLGALATCLYLVVFSDLAFAWSTTLRPDPVRVHRLTGTLSWPWAHLAPSAVPSESLIRETLYYRQAGVPTDSNPAQWGQWWPFLMASLITYGLLPRCLLLVLANWRLRGAVSRAFLALPGVTAIQDRLASEWVTTQATGGPEADPTTAPAAAPDPPASVHSPPARELLVVDWGGVDVQEAEVQHRVRTGWGHTVVGVRQAGGRSTLDSDAAVIQEAAQGPADRGVAVLVKAWEPPVHEALDFVRDLRNALGPHRLLVICPVGVSAAGRPSSPEPAELQRWERSARAGHDPALVVRAWPAGGRP
jgi:hypothetical protein